MKRSTSATWLVGIVMLITSVGMSVAFAPILDCHPTIGMEVEEPPSGPPRPRFDSGSWWLIPCPRCNGTGKITILRKTQRERRIPEQVEASPSWATAQAKKTSWVQIGSAAEGPAFIAADMLSKAGISAGMLEEQGRTLIYVPSEADQDTALWALKKCALRGLDVEPRDWAKLKPTTAQ